MKRYFSYIVLGLMLVACQRSPELTMTVHECAPMPTARASATAFVVGEQAYIFAGRDSAEHKQSDLWRYTPSTDSWDYVGSTPLITRVNGCACVVDDKVYIGLGFNGYYNKDTSYLRDWWEYTPKTNTWTRLADYPNDYTDDATAFAGDGELYVGYGFCWKYRRDMFRYSIADNRWDSIDVGVGFHGFPTRSFGGTGCTCQGRHFMGTGYYGKSLNWWAEFLPEGRWERRADVPGKARTIAASTASDHYVYLCGGMHYGGVNTSGEVLQDIRRYDPQTNKWQWAANMPQGLINHVCFRIGRRIYFGLGEDENWKVTNKLYYIEE